jgi:aconitate hydratase
VVAYALAGTIDVDLLTDPLGTDPTGYPVFLRDIWPEAREVQDVIAGILDAEMITRTYADVFTGDHRWPSTHPPGTPSPGPPTPPTSAARPTWTA